MKKFSLPRVVQTGLIVLYGGAVLCSSFLRPHGARGENAAGGYPVASPNADIIAVANKLHVKFQGTATCSGTSCHGKAAADPAPARAGNENTLWNGKDPHHKAFDSLSNDLGKKIAANPLLNIAGGDASKSAKCLGCHALDAPADLQASNFDPAEGVTCNSCHGAYEKWGDAHQKHGWIEQQRKASGHRGIMDTFARYDTLPLHFRAEKCTSCHLAIDPQMIEAGHPQPTFELNYFSTTYDDRHWRDKDGYFTVQLWANGQAVSLREALIQVADRAAAGATAEAIKQAYDQAMGHYSVFNQLFKSGAISDDIAAVDAEVQKLGKAVEAKDNAAITAAGHTAADDVKKLDSAVEKFEPSKASTLKVLAGVTGQTNLATTFGRRAQEQQAYAIFALYSGYSSAEKPPDAEAVTAAIGEKLFADNTPSADFEKGLADLTPKLPKP